MFFVLFQCIPNGKIFIFYINDFVVPRLYHFVLKKTLQLNCSSVDFESEMSQKCPYDIVDTKTYKKQKHEKNKLMCVKFYPVSFFTGIIDTHR